MQLLLVSILALFAIVEEKSLGGFVTSFESAMQSGTPAPGWSYMWNGGGEIGNEQNYVALLPTSLSNSFYTSSGGALPGPAPGGFVYFGITDNFNNLTTSTGSFTNMPGGHPGLGSNQTGSGGTERFAIANFTVSNPGVYRIANGLLANSDSSVDGLNLRVYVNDTLISFGKTAPGQNSTFVFQAELGELLPGDNIYVAIGSNLSDGNDEFALRYTISAVPEPSSVTAFLLGTAFIGLVTRSRRNGVAARGHFI